MISTVFPMLPFYGSLKQKPIARTLFQMDIFFQFSDKKSHLPHADTNKYFRNSKKQRIIVKQGKEEPMENPG